MNLQNNRDANVLPGMKNTEMVTMQPLDQAIAICGRQLLGNGTAEHPVQEALAGLIRVSGCHHAALFQIESYHAEDFRGRWLACATQGGCAHCGDDREWEYLPLIDENTRTRLGKGCSLQIRIDQVPDAFQHTLVTRDIKNLLILPLIVLRKWWGSLCIESTQANFEWTPEQVSDLETVATLFSVYYERQHADEGRQERDKLSGALEMAGTVCHKLNQPMQVILGYASMVTSGDISAAGQIKEVVQLIEDETRQMGIITKNLMGITKNRGNE